MTGPMELALAFLLDLAIGDPAWLPHPVRIIGGAITRLERLLRARCPEYRERAAGMVLVALIVFPSALAAYGLQYVLKLHSRGIPAIVGMILLVYLMGTTIALRELIVSAKKVIDAVRAGHAEAAKQNLAMIVGRDTAGLSSEGMLRATIETLAENLSDGVVAPIFYLTIGGLPLAIAYKAINTLDSMVGYKNEQYVRFGWAAAKVDDLANYIPARLSGLLIAAVAWMTCRSWAAAGASLRIMRRDGRNHTSPNSGMPEAAMAGALGVRLGGPSTYGGCRIEKPYIGDALTKDYLSASAGAISIVAAASCMLTVSAVFLLFLRDMR